jgi:hypothetical protein
LDARKQFPNGRAEADRGVLADLADALRVGPSNAEVHYKAAQIVLMFGNGDGPRRTEAVGHLAEAVRLGRDPRTLRADSFLRTRLTDPDDFEELERLTPGPPPPYLDAHLALPPDL